jgi:hypothetical protein
VTLPESAEHLAREQRLDAEAERQGARLRVLFFIGMALIAIVAFVSGQCVGSTP